MSCIWKKNSNSILRTTCFLYRSIAVIRAIQEFTFFAKWNDKTPEGSFAPANLTSRMNSHAHKVVGSTKDEKLPIPIDRTYILQKKTMED